MKEILKNDTVDRVIKTFIQGFLGALVVTLSTTTDYSNMTLLKSALVGAVAGGISAVMNLIINKLETKKEE